MSNMKRSLYIGAAFVAIIVALVAGRSALKRATAAQGRGGAQVPIFKVDPLWPKPLPNHWVLGSVTGVAVDGQDHIWITHRGADSLGNNEKGAILNPPTGFFFFQAEDGIRDFHVTGVHTCTLPICRQWPCIGSGATSAHPAAGSRGI